jgi:Phage terminase, small subunit
MNPRQQKFVVEMLQHGNKVQAYRTAYSNQTSCPRTIESAADRLLRKPEVLAAITATMELARKQVEQDIQSQLHHQLLDRNRKRELLTQIAEGESLTRVRGTKKDPDRVVYVQPSVAQRLRAIDMDSRLCGEYEEVKQSVIRRQQDGSTPPPPAK